MRVESMDGWQACRYPDRAEQNRTEHGPSESFRLVFWFDLNSRASFLELRVEPASGARYLGRPGCLRALLGPNVAVFR